MRARRVVFAALLVAFAPLVVACGQLLGVKVFSEAPDGGDANADRDAGTDARHDVVAPRDVTTSHDVVVPDDGAPPPHDAPSGRDAGRADGPAIDGGHLVDAVTPDDAPACVPTPSFESDPANCGVCGHSCGGGACSGGQCQPVTLASGLAWPLVSTVDSNSVYWATYGIDGGNGSVAQAAKDGGRAFTLFNGGKDIWDIASDGTYVFWDVVNRKDIYRAPVGTTVFATLSINEGLPSQLAVDPLAGQVYWIDREAPNPSAPPDATAAEKYMTSVTVRATDAATPEVVLTTDPSFFGGNVVIDEHYVYFSTGNVPKQIKRIPRDGGCPDASACGEPLLPLGASAAISSLAVDDASIYWVESNAVADQLGIGPKVPGASGQLILSTPDPISSVYVDGSYVYVSLFAAAGQVVRYHKDGTGMTVLATGQAWPTALAGDPTALYWLDSGTKSNDAATPAFNMGDGTLVKLAK